MPCACSASARVRWDLEWCSPKRSDQCTAWRVVRAHAADKAADLLLAHGATDKGRVRPVNEDCWAFEPSRGLCVVADGMGGHKAGDVAARIAVETIVSSVTTGVADSDWPFGFDPSLSDVGNRLRTAVQLAHMHILETAGSCWCSRRTASTACWTTNASNRSCWMRTTSKR